MGLGCQWLFTVDKLGGLWNQWFIMRYGIANFASQRTSGNRSRAVTLSWLADSFCGAVMVSTLSCNETTAGGGCLVGHLNNRGKSNANTNPVNTGMAMSLAQADAVLAKYGYVEAVVVTA